MNPDNQLEISVINSISINQTVNSHPEVGYPNFTFMKLIALTFLIGTVGCQGGSNQSKSTASQERTSPSEASNLTGDRVIDLVALSPETTPLGIGARMGILYLYRDKSADLMSNPPLTQCRIILLSPTVGAFALRSCQPEVPIAELAASQFGIVRTAGAEASLSDASSEDRSVLLEVDCERGCLRVGKVSKGDAKLSSAYLELKTRANVPNKVAINPMSSDDLVNLLKATTNQENTKTMVASSLQYADWKLDSSLSRKAWDLKTKNTPHCQEYPAGYEQIDGSPILTSSTGNAGGDITLRGFLLAQTHQCPDGKRGMRWQVSTIGLDWLHQKFEEHQKSKIHETQSLRPKDTEVTKSQESAPSPSTNGGLGTSPEWVEAPPYEGDDLSYPEEVSTSLNQVDNSKSATFNLAGYAPRPPIGRPAADPTKVTSSNFPGAFVEIVLASKTNSSSTRLCWGIALKSNKALIISSCADQLASAPPTGFEFRAVRGDSKTKFKVLQYTDIQAMTSGNFALLNTGANFFTIFFSISATSCSSTGTPQTFAQESGVLKVKSLTGSVASMNASSRFTEFETTDKLWTQGPFLEASLPSASIANIGTPWVLVTDISRAVALSALPSIDNRSMLAYGICAAAATEISSKL
jgi:hypothetical protein